MKFFLFLLTFLSTAFAQVELFEHSGGTPGRSWRLEKPGYYQSDLGHFGDNCVSAILIMDGWEVKLWEHPKSWNKGRTIELQSGLHDLHALGFGDCLTGITVSKKAQGLLSPEEHKRNERKKKEITESILSFAKKVKSYTGEWKVLVLYGDEHDFAFYFTILLRAQKCNADILKIEASADKTKYETECKGKNIRFFIFAKNDMLSMVEIYQDGFVKTLFSKNFEIGNFDFNLSTVTGEKLFLFAKKLAEKKISPGIDLIESCLKKVEGRKISFLKPGIEVSPGKEANGDIVIVSGSEPSCGVIVDVQGETVTAVFQAGDSFKKKVVDKSCDKRIYRPTN